MPPALPESNFWWSSNLRPWGNMFLLSQAYVLETLHCSQSFLLSTVNRMGIQQKTPQIVNQWKRLPNCSQNGNVCEDAHESLFFPLGRVFWGFSRSHYVPLWFQPPLGLGRPVASCGEHYLAFKRVSLAMGWFAPRRHQESYLKLTMWFFLGAAFRWSRACHSDRIRVTVCSFLLRASGCLQGVGWDTATSRSGWAPREVMLLWQARSRGFRIHRSSARSGPMVGFSATSCSNSDHPAGAEFSFTSFSHFRTPNVTGQALSQPASAWPRTVSAEAAWWKPHPHCGSLAWGGRSATYALTAVLPGGTLWRQRVHQHPRSVLRRDRGVLSRPAGRE